MTKTQTRTTDDTVGPADADITPPPERLVLEMWRTPVYQADCSGAAEHLPHLRRLVRTADEADRRAAAESGRATVIRSSQSLLSWDHPSVDWLRQQIGIAGDALAHAVLGETADEIDDRDVHTEAWAVVCGPGEFPRPHTRHDSAWSGLLSIAADPVDDTDAGHLYLLDPRPAALDRPTSSGAVRFSPVPGRMIAFPGWQAHWMKATAADSRLRIAIAWNITYHGHWSRTS
ncbi:putative 2-oxoglutarate-Fe(II)-dependent oxygenase superfamily protein [Actinomadura pelletieri DSM 43383]|uniref:Putative 2-oxoglutarate-Fe(II)-dependent oxygenase superfamily protein n=1 Tax=Actinomadura pelletieri DSM 43383 TaxID=1120940 RepID=A0A495QSN7_9ACTN|nr:putative 2OG-Fe(II) oxygenase [Actinomadura pelletieri]RKS76421.1 putative 2-oxoglutarate-Fe(II)-dependent oxygenase superfamily protein [Actinomadura pelletieri DSM 43383]